MTDASKTSIYLPGDLKERIAGSGRRPAELIRLGLDALDAAAITDSVRSAVRDELEPLAARLDALEKAVTASGVQEDGSEGRKPAAARAEPARPAPKSRARAQSVNAAAKMIADRPRAALRALQSVTPGTQVFQEPGADPVAGHPVPEPADHSGKRGLAR